MISLIVTEIREGCRYLILSPIIFLYILYTNIFLNNNFLYYLHLYIKEKVFTKL